MGKEQLRILRLTHENADISIREKFCLTPIERTSFYQLLRDTLDIRESLIVTTCNRTEIYYFHHEEQSESIFRLLCASKALPSSNYFKYFKSVTNEQEAMYTLFAVSIGLDSQVLGDQQIFGQVKEAYTEATDLGFAGAFTHRMMHTIFYTHKQVCQSTGFKNGAMSLSYNAVKAISGQPPTSSILVLGVGKMGEDVCNNLLNRGYTNITLANRTEAKAIEKSSSLGINWLSIEKVYESLDQYQIIFSAVSGQTPFFDAPAVMNDETWMVDLSTPRSTSSQFRTTHSLRYLDIDEIGQLTEQTLQKREKEIPKVVALIQAGMDELCSRKDLYAQTFYLQKFKHTLETVRKEVLASYQNKVQQEQEEILEDVSLSIIRRIIKLPAIQLRQACQRDKAERLGNALHELFDNNLNTYNQKQT